MNYSPLNKPKQQSAKANPLETLLGLNSGGSQPKPESSIGHEAIEQLKKPSPSYANPEFTKVLFDRSTHFEQYEVPETIKRLVQEIEQMVVETAAIGREAKAELDEISSSVMNMGSDRKGVYHIYYLEQLKKVLANIRAKISDARTWMKEVKGKQARGSLFGKRQKEKGNEYTGSPDVSTARAVN